MQETIKLCLGNDRVYAKDLNGGIETEEMKLCKEQWSEYKKTEPIIKPLLLDNYIYSRNLHYKSIEIIEPQSKLIICSNRVPVIDTISNEIKF